MIRSLPFALWSTACLLALMVLPWVVRAEPVRTVEHALGETRIEDTPQRIVTLYQGVTDSALALGLEPVGVVESWLERPMYHYLRDSLPDDVRYLGLETQPELEAIAGLAPDLIVAARHRHADIYPLLSRIAPTVAVGDVYEVEAGLELLGKATGREAEAKSMLVAWEERLADFQCRAASRLGDAWPQSVSVISFRGDHVRIYYKGFARHILDQVGFLQPKAHQGGSWGVKLVSRENIPAMDADAIFVFMRDDPVVAEQYRDWTAHPLWQNLSAVKGDRVHHVDPVIWNMGAGITAANRMLDELYAHYQLESNGRKESDSEAADRQSEETRSC
ncbi:ABC transporter substrate-binding protein [Vreelandella aquamarina]|uniref:ABC transporter substrate-binding protein n=1 Tax=Vreelandella aquamarina TaxID=77097 RepID=UPI00384BF22F